MIPINVILLQGGLGNQMFQYANAFALRKKHPFQLMLFEYNESVYTHGGLLIFKIFKNIDEHNKVNLCHFIKKRAPKLLTAFRKDIGEVEPSKRAFVISKHYIGFYQNESFFNEFEKEIHNCFRFNTQLLNDKTSQISNTIKDQNSISLHIRRGDYLNEGDTYNTYTLQYYYDGINYINSIYDNCQIYVFSDDIPWCRNNLKIQNTIFVDWNNGIDSWQDMYLMSLCKHNIIANSTFSWWGAWLNSNPDKIVIAPKIWRQDKQDEKIIPATWIKL